MSEPVLGSRPVPVLHVLHKNIRGVKPKTTRRRGVFYGFYGFYTSRKGCVRDARPPARVAPALAALHTSPSEGVKSVKSVKPGDGRGVFCPPGCKTGCKFYTSAAVGVPA